MTDVGTGIGGKSEVGGRKEVGGVPPGPVLLSLQEVV